MGHLLFAQRQDVGIQLEMYLVVLLVLLVPFLMLEWRIAQERELMEERQMLTNTQAEDFATYLGREYDFKILPFDHPGVNAALVGLKVVCGLVPGIGLLAIAELEKLEGKFEHTTVTLPLPWGGSLVVLSKHAKDTAEGFATVIAHEAEHARQIKELGNWRTIVDYLGSTELRAAREASAYSVGMWLEYLLLGRVPVVPVQSISSSTYHLPIEDVELAVNLMKSNLETITHATCPPLSVAQKSYLWLKAQAPKSIRAYVEESK